MNTPAPRPDDENSETPIDPPLCGRAPGVDDETYAQFLKSVEAFESAPLTTLSRLLIADGIELPPPDSFTENSVSDKLWEVIRGMARRRYFLDSTNHFSDLELYQKLWTDTLNEPGEDLTNHPFPGNWHIDLVGSGSEEHTELWLRHYADEADRAMWAADFPDDVIPEHVDPPHDRDRHLPQAYPEWPQG